MSHAIKFVTKFVYLALAATVTSNAMDKVKTSYGVND